MDNRVLSTVSSETNSSPTCVGSLCGNDTNNNVVKQHIETPILEPTHEEEVVQDDDVSIYTEAYDTTTPPNNNTVAYNNNNIDDEENYEVELKEDSIAVLISGTNGYEQEVSTPKRKKKGSSMKKQMKKKIMSGLKSIQNSSKGDKEDTAEVLEAFDETPPSEEEDKEVSGGSNEEELDIVNEEEELEIEEDVDTEGVEASSVAELAILRQASSVVEVSPTTKEDDISLSEDVNVSSSTSTAIPSKEEEYNREKATKTPDIGGLELSASALLLEKIQKREMSRRSIKKKLGFSKLKSFISSSSSSSKESSKGEKEGKTDNKENLEVSTTNNSDTKDSSVVTVEDGCKISMSSTKNNVSPQGGELEVSDDEESHESDDELQGLTVSEYNIEKIVISPVDNNIEKDDDSLEEESLEPPTDAEKVADMSEDDDDIDDELDTPNEDVSKGVKKFMSRVKLSPKKTPFNSSANDTQVVNEVEDVAPTVEQGVEPTKIENMEHADVNAQGLDKLNTGSTEETNGDSNTEKLMGLSSTMKRSVSNAFVKLSPKSLLDSAEAEEEQLDDDLEDGDNIPGTPKVKETKLDDKARVKLHRVQRSIVKVAQRTKLLNVTKKTDKEASTKDCEDVASPPQVDVAPQSLTTKEVEPTTDVNKGIKDESKTDSLQKDTSATGIDNMSVFEVTKPKMEEEKKKPLEFQHTKVTLKFKALAGITKVSSKSQEPNDSANPSVKAVVTYRRNTIASNRFVSTHVPSLPIFCEQTSDTSNSKVYASWPGWKDDDLCVTDTNDSALQMSSVSFNRTVRRARNYDDLSKQGTVGGESAVKKPNTKDSKKFLSSLSKAFAPELLDLKIGLMSGSNELIPLGVATVVIPGECKRLELDIPVVRNHSVVSEALTKKKKAQSKDHVHFSNDKDTVYKVDEGAFLRLELNIEPAPTVPQPSSSRDTNHTNIQKPMFTGTGPINQALRRRRKMDRLMSQTKRLPLHQRAQLYLELRSRKKNNTYKKLSANSHEVDITRQSEVSEVTCGVSSVAVDVDELEDDDESVPASALALVIDQYQTDSNKHESDLETVNEQRSSNSMVASKTETKSIVTEMNQDLASSVGKADDTSNKEKEEEEASAVPVSIGSLMENISRNGKESPAHDTFNNDSSVSDFSTEFSSSLYSVFSTDHPQRATIAQEMMNILSCDPNLALTEEERAACKHYSFENEDYKYACCLPIVEEDDDVSITDDTVTCHDDNTFASLGSGLSLNGYNKK